MKAKTIVLGIIFAAAGLGVIAAVVWSFLLAPAEDAAVRYVPPDAALYVNVFTDPSNGQKARLRDLFDSFPIEGEPEDAVGRDGDFLRGGARACDRRGDR